MTLINNSNGNNSPIDQKNLQQFTEKVVTDLGGAITAVLVYIGDKLGLYRAMADAGKPITSQELATITKTSERVVREWLASQQRAVMFYTTHRRRDILYPLKMH